MPRLLLCTIAALSLFVGLGAVAAQDGDKDKDKKKEKPPEKKILDKTIGEWIKILKEHDDPKWRRGSLIALEYGDASNTVALPAIVEAAEKDKDATVRAAAVRVIGNLDPKMRPGATKVLITSLQKDKDGNVREVAANVLGNAKFNKPASEYVSEIADCLKDTHTGARIAVATTLRNMGDGAAPALPKLLEAAGDAKEHKLVREAAVHVISRYGKDNAQTQPLLVGLAKTADNPASLREIALDGLGRLGSDQADVIKTLTDTLVDTNLDLRKASASALGQLGPKAKGAWPTIKDRLTYKLDKEASRPIAAEPDSSVRNHLIRLSGVLGKDTTAAIDVLADVTLRDDSTENRIAAIQELGELGSRAKSAVKTLTILAQQDGRAAVRDAASKALKNINE